MTESVILLDLKGRLPIIVKRASRRAVASIAAMKVTDEIIPERNFFDDSFNSTPNFFISGNCLRKLTELRQFLPTRQLPAGNF